jgi:hypothetical protein
MLNKLTFTGDKKQSAPVFGCALFAAGGRYFQGLSV